LDSWDIEVIYVLRTLTLKPVCPTKIFEIELIITQDKTGRQKRSFQASEDVQRWGETNPHTNGEEEWSEMAFISQYVASAEASGH
jgi:hypothetical protein